MGKVGAVVSVARGAREAVVGRSGGGGGGAREVMAVVEEEEDMVATLMQENGRGKPW